MRTLANLRFQVNVTLHRYGWEIARYPSSESAGYKRQLLLKHLSVQSLIDVGANEGQFAVEVRQNGYKGKILSLEPLPDAFTALEAHAASDPCWEVRRTAVGSSAGTLNFYVAGNSVSSSPLLMLERHRRAAPNSATIDEIVVPVDTLNRILTEPAQRFESAYLKVDTQGFEKQVLDGACDVLSRIAAVELEISLYPLYKDQPLFDEILEYLARRDFRLAGVAPGFWNRQTGETFQFDGIFLRHQAL